MFNLYLNSSFIIYDLNIYLYNSFIAMCLISVLSWVEGTWKTGYYNSSGVCNKWEETCKTCTDGTSWSSCFTSMFLNSATGYWQTCPYSQYYDSTAKVWRDCNGTWNESWSYQKTWFIWPDSQVYDLDSLAWVNSCDSTKVSINNSQYQNIPICKSTNIYVDPTSTSFVELGTQANPYKKLLIAFIEILNLHSHTSRTINVFVKAGTTVYVMPDYIYLIDISNVNVFVYNDVSSTASRVNIISLLSGVSLVSK